MTAISVILVISIAVFLPPKKNHRNGDAMTEIEMNDFRLQQTMAVVDKFFFDRFCESETNWFSNVFQLKFDE